MKVVIAGPRDLNPTVHTVEIAVKNSGFPLTEVAAGGASGVDEAALYYARAHNRKIRVFHPDWERAERLTGNRLAAGPIRNMRMAEYADALIVIKRPGPTTKGTTSMIAQAEKRGLPVYVEEVV